MATGAEICARRRARLAARLKEGVALLASPGLPTHHADVFRPDPDLYYLTGLVEHDSALALEIRGGRIREETAFCPPRDEVFERWNGELLGPVRTRRRLGLAAARPWSSRAEFVRASLRPDLVAWAKTADRQTASLALAGPSAGIHDLAPALARLRMVKDRGEIAAIARSCELAAGAQRRVLQALPAAAAENQLQAELDHAYAAGGARHAFRPIVAAGRNACVAHYGANRAPLRKGQLVLVDSGCELDFYVSDITRTYPVAGRFTPAQRDLYETVLAAQAQAIRKAKPGASFGALQRAACRELAYGLRRMGICRGTLPAILASESFGRYYFHSIGHSVGLDAHDPVDAPAGRDELKLAAGMAITVEPGLYLDGDRRVPAELRHTGVRIEDILAITAAGSRVLTAAAPKTVRDIEAAA
ncbi:MAG: aminopeptidase P family protein [Betaproteobacteria bacterium AqS2]|uniref:Xaa-Pro aminopeptidase n=1 Tax=Candidatus Amphirhobacter heronislandensis TaxID=1732024 RepID=A0A930Y263_9GAMM|nr:aminopeptidase P family protein [Betaproteobacteria bacterium AqS2]